MSKQNKEKEVKKNEEQMEEATATSEETTVESAQAEGTAEAAEGEVISAVPEESLESQIKEQEDKYLRLLAEYDNFRKRSQREREAAWSTAKAETAAAFLPVYDNLQRALKQETADEAYAKGVQMTMTQLRSILEKLKIEEIPALGETFDPELHNAVMHIEDESLGANTIAEVFETGFRAEGKVIRHAMVKVAN